MFLLDRGPALCLFSLTPKSTIRQLEMLNSSSFMHHALSGIASDNSDGPPAVRGMVGSKRRGQLILGHPPVATETKASTSSAGKPSAGTGFRHGGAGARRWVSSLHEVTRSIGRKSRLHPPNHRGGSPPVSARDNIWSAFPHRSPLMSSTISSPLEIKALKLRHHKQQLKPGLFCLFSLWLVLMKSECRPAEAGSAARADLSPLESASCFTSHISSCAALRCRRRLRCHGDWDMQVLFSPPLGRTRTD